MGLLERFRWGKPPVDTGPKAEESEPVVPVVEEPSETPEPAAPEAAVEQKLPGGFSVGQKVKIDVGTI